MINLRKRETFFVGLGIRNVLSGSTINVTISIEITQSIASEGFIYFCPLGNFDIHPHMKQLVKCNFKFL